LIDAFEHDPSAKNRITFAYLISQRAEPDMEPDVEPVLIEALKDENTRIRIHAARGLARTGGSGAVAALTEALHDDGRSVVREEAAEALGRIGGSEVVESLVAALEDRSVRVRLYASHYLARVGDKSALPEMRRVRNRTWGPWRFLISRNIRTLDDDGP
jgi:HEAT repeat protein